MKLTPLLMSQSCRVGSSAQACTLAHGSPSISRAISSYIGRNLLSTKAGVIDLLLSVRSNHRNVLHHYPVTESKASSADIVTMRTDETHSGLQHRHRRRHRFSGLRYPPRGSFAVHSCLPTAG
jgi:hypothetical protein